MQKILALFLLVTCVAQSRAVEIKQETDSFWRILGTDYEAIVAGDGCLTNLKVKGNEFFAPGVSISRGAYFFQDGPQKLETIERPSDNIITASSALADVKYEFAPDSMTWTIHNKTQKEMAYCVVLDPAVRVGVTSGDRAVRLPSVQSVDNVAMILRNSVLRINAAARMWGPWALLHPIWEIKLAAGESRTINFNFKDLTTQETELVDQLSLPPPETDLTVLSPQDYQVFQRQTRLSGSVRVSGRTRLKTTNIEIRFKGSPMEGALSSDWIQIPVDPTTGTFNKTLTLAAGGWYSAEVRASANGSSAAVSVEHLGVGEVFVGAGQSNSTNSGGDGKLQTQSKMVSSFGGASWQLADDPQPGAHDNSTGGSFWPAFGDAMYERYRVPIGVAVTGFGGTSVDQWQKGDGLFLWTLTRMAQLGPGGFRALLWHQGESDVEKSTERYRGALHRIIRDMQAAAGWDFPFFVAQVSYRNPNNPSYDSTRAGQKALWDAGIAMEGPDTDTLTGDNRDIGGKGIHFSIKGLNAHGRMWAEKVSAFVDKELARE